MSEATPLATPVGEGVRLRLYVAGDAPNSRVAIAALRSVLAQARVHVDLEIIDVLSQPELGLRDGVLLTPMLIRTHPPPERRLLGNLGDRAKLIDVLALGGEPNGSRDVADRAP